MLEGTDDPMISYAKQRTAIDRIFDETKTIAVVGFSSNPARAGYTVPAYLQQSGYRVIPVNPNLDHALGERAFPDLRSVPDPIDLVLIFRRSQFVGEVVDQAIEVGAKAVWMQLNVHDEQAAARAQQAGMTVVMDACMAVEHRRRPTR